MERENPMRKPRTLADLKAHPAVNDIFREDDPWDNRRGSWWCNLNPGWICEDMECGTIHEDTIRKVCLMFDTVVYVGE
jgi:hypothetical protein